MTKKYLRLAWPIFATLIGAVVSVVFVLEWLGGEAIGFAILALALIGNGWVISEVWRVWNLPE